MPHRESLGSNARRHRPATQPNFSGIAGASHSLCARQGDFDVFTAHILTGDGNGRKKIDTFQVLVAELRGVNDSPRVRTGVFNEPKRFEDSGQIVTVQEYEDGCWRDRFAAKRPRFEWINGVLSVLGGVSHHGLRDA